MSSKRGKTLFGRSFTVELSADSHQLLYVIDDFLKQNGISYINQVEPTKLRGYGDAGMGIFEIEKRKDREKQLKLYVDTNSPISAAILENLILNVLDYMEENNLYESDEKLDKEEDTLPTGDIEKEAILCEHKYTFLKEEELFGLEVSVFICDQCKKLEFYKKND